MLFNLLLVVSSLRASCADELTTKASVFPIPFELPNRNDRSNQCWLRIEDVELVETLSIYCFLANEFLRVYIADYNSRKMQEDDVYVSLWSEKPKNNEEKNITEPSDFVSSGQRIRDWKVATVLDPTTHIRIYVTEKADCRIIMYSRDAMTNYKVDCPKVLYFLNRRTYGTAGVFSVNTSLITAVLVINILRYL
ncbi:hypothetical protein NE865_15205 [Phthorimaea operculella]|nr:hypothetical protein NE865_15205 [Phthorimaea operculella]